MTSRNTANILGWLPSRPKKQPRPAPKVYLRFEGLIWPLREVYSRFEGLMAEYSRSKIGGMALTRMGFYMRSSCRPAP